MTDLEDLLTFLFIIVLVPIMIIYALKNIIESQYYLRQQRNQEKYKQRAKEEAQRSQQLQRMEKLKKRIDEAISIRREEIFREKSELFGYMPKRITLDPDEIEKITVNEEARLLKEEYEMKMAARIRAQQQREEELMKQKEERDRVEREREEEEWKLFLEEYRLNNGEPENMSFLRLKFSITRKRSKS